MRARTLLVVAPALAAALTLARAADDSPAGDVLAPPDGLAVEGVPAIPSSLAAQVGSWVSVQPRHFTAWHPTRREMVISSSVDGVVQVHSLAAPMAEPVQMTRAKTPTAYAIFPRHRSDYSILVRGLEGNPNALQLYRADQGAKKLELVTDGKSRNWFGPWSNAGDRLAYTALSLDGKTTSVCVVDPTDRASARVLCSLDGALWYPTDWSKDDKSLLLLEVVSMTESWLWSVDVESGERTAVIARGSEKMGFGWANYGRDGKSILLASDKGAEFQRPCRLDRETGKLEPIGDAIRSHVERFALSPDRKTLAVVTNEDGCFRIHVLDADTGAEHPYPKLPRGSVSFVTFHENGKDLAFELETARSPAETWSLDLETGAVEKWAESGVSAPLAASAVEPELVQWKGEGGLALSGWLTKPAAKWKGKRPVVVQLHEGPNAQARPTFNAHRAYLASELGVAVLEPNVRGSSGQGKSFLALDDGPRRADAIKDVGALLDWIKTRGDLDADRVLLSGTRYGGFMSLACAIEYDARIRGTIDVGGWVDLVTFVEETPESRQAVVRAEYGDEQDPKVRELLDQLSPITNAARIKKPLLVAQGAKDPRVPLEKVEQVVAAARKNGIKVWYLVGKEEQAGFASPKNAAFVFCASVQFIREVLLGEQEKEKSE